MSPVAQRYFAIEQEILWSRAHGGLIEGREDQVLEESDALCLKMTDDERAAADERGRAYVALRTAKELPLFGTTVTVGGSEAPRRAARHRAACARDG